jgi:hypothetical protein
MATPATIVRVVRAAVLLGENVLDMEGGCGRRDVGQVTVFTAAAGPLPDKLAKDP